MVVVVCMAVLATGCAAHELRCDGRLEPINVPAGAAATQPREAAAEAPGGP